MTLMNENMTQQYTFPINLHIIPTKLQEKSDTEYILSRRCRDYLGLDRKFHG